jgi:tyrosine-protein kinase Etk/Wzc
VTRDEQTEAAEERTIELGRLWDRVLARRRGIALLVVAATLVTAVVAFVLPPWYTATASLMPPGEDVSFGIGNLLKGIGVPGVKVPSQATPAEVFQAILQSRRVNEAIVRRFDLQALYRKKYMVDTIKELRRHAGISVNDVGLIIVNIEDKDPKRAADMANAYCEELDRFNRESRMTRGRRVRQFIGSRMDSTRRELDLAEQRLVRYESRHKAVALSPEASSALEAASRIYATRSALELRLGVLRSFSVGTTDEERQIIEQLAQIDRQLARLPQTGMELAKLIRDVKVGEQLYIMLTAQYEDARINETRDVATVDQLDVATPPERKSRPRRLQMIAVAFLLSLVAGVAHALLRDDGGARTPEPRAGG